MLVLEPLVLALALVRQVLALEPLVLVRQVLVLKRLMVLRALVQLRAARALALALAALGGAFDLV